MEHWSESILRWLDANEIDIHIKIKSIRKTGGGKRGVDLDVKFRE